MDEEQTLGLYEEILKGAQMGINSIDEILKKTEGEDAFQEELLRTQSDYKYIAFEANERIRQLGGVPRELPVSTRISTWGMIAARSVFDSSPENMSKLMLKGIDMADDALSDYQQRFINAEDRAKQLADRLQRMQTEQRSVYRKYLN